MDLVTYRATSYRLSGFTVESTARGFSLVMDEPAELRGTDQGMNPVEAFLCAIGSCQVIAASAYARLFGINLHECQVELEGDVDLDGRKPRPNGSRPGLQEIRYRMVIRAAADEAELGDFNEFLQRHCPLIDTIENGTRLVSQGILVQQPELAPA
jgi:uncharacterized OsmC-like protein